MMRVFPIRTGPSTPAQFASAFDESHPAIDIFGPLGAEVLAVADGRVRHAREQRGGKVVYLVEPDGTQYFYGHLDQFVAPELAPGATRPVKAGEVIGYLGATGSAQGTPPHVHFEVRPQGGERVDPFPLLTEVAERVLSKDDDDSADNVIPLFPGQKPNSLKPHSSESGWGLALVAVALFILVSSRKKGRR